MKNTFTTIIPALALTSVMGAGAASAAAITDVKTPINTASVLLSVDEDNIATLTGDVRSYSDNVELGEKVLQLDEVEEVRNFLSY